MTNLFGSKNLELNSSTIVGLTPSGKQLAGEESQPGVKYDILISLSHGEKTIGDLARDILQSFDTTKKCLLNKMRGSVRFQDVE